MTTQAESLFSLLDELNHIEKQIWDMTKSNEQCIAETRAHIRDAAAQLPKRSGEPNRSISENGSFFVPRSRSRT